MSRGSNADQEKKKRAAAASLQRRRTILGAAAEAKKVVDQLDEDGKAALRAVRVHKLIPEHQETKLASLKLVERKLGGLGLTPLGKLAADLIGR